MFTVRQFPAISSHLQSASALKRCADTDSPVKAACSPLEGAISSGWAMAAVGADRLNVRKKTQSSDAASASEDNLPTIPFMGKTIPGLGQ